MHFPLSPVSFPLSTGLGLDSPSPLDSLDAEQKWVWFFCLLIIISDLHVRWSLARRLGLWIIHIIYSLPLGGHTSAQCVCFHGLAEHMLASITDHWISEHCTSCYKKDDLPKNSPWIWLLLSLKLFQTRMIFFWEAQNEMSCRLTLLFFIYIYNVFLLF